jgi:glycosyltransferase domain-containing protein
MSQDMKAQTNQLTIMLAQYGRHQFSDRFFSFLQKTGCPYPIIYADGNADGFSVDLCKTYKDCLDIELVEYKQSQKFQDYFTMMVKGLEAVKTPYVMLCDNDDFIIQSSIEKLLIFLNNNPAYVSAGSPIIEMQIDNFSTNFTGKKSTLVGRYAHFRDEEPLPSWEDQINDTFLEFQPNFYHIYRREVLLKIWKEILECDFSDLTIMEFYYQLRAPTFGKQYSDPSITHYIRQSGTGSWESKDYDFSRQLVYNDLPKDIRLVADRIGKILSENFNEDYHAMYAKTLDSYAKHLNNYLPHNVMRWRWPRLFSIKISILKVTNKLTILHNLIFSMKEFRFQRKLKKIMGNSYLQFMQEIAQIKNILED